MTEGVVMMTLIGAYGLYILWGMRGFVRTNTLTDTYRPTGIRVEQHGRFSYAATIVRQDIAEPLPGTPEEDLPAFRGMPVDDGPYCGFTHRRAWRKAFRAAGGRLY